MRYHLKSRYLFIFFLAVSQFSCLNQEKKKKVVTAKWAFVQSNADNCEDDGSNSPTSCVFRFNGRRYLRTESYILDFDGKVDSVYSYNVPLGVNKYTLEDYGKLMMNLSAGRFEEMKEKQITWSSETNKLIDGGDMPENFLLQGNKVIVIDGDKLTIYDLKDMI
ncbi:MAG: hypothetical protein AAFP77_09050 [Bacteroidota bacterium]